MSRRVVRLTVYKNRANPVTLSLKQSVGGVETDVDFTNVTRMVLSLDPNGSEPVVVDSDTDIGAIDFSTNGQVEFDIGELAQVKAMAEGQYEARLTALDAVGNPTELVNEDNLKTAVFFLIRDTSALP